MQKMTEDQFQDWKASSEFFFDYLAERHERLTEIIGDFGKQLGEATPDQVPAIHKAATMLCAQSETLGQIRGLEAADIFGGDDE